MGKKIINKIKIKIRENFIRIFFGDPKKIIKHFFLKKYFHNIEIQSTFETLDQIEQCITNKKGGVYLRFGDGDVFLMNLKDDSFQVSNINLANEISEAFQLLGKNVYKSLPIHSDLFGFDQGMFIGNHKNDDQASKQFVFETFQYFIGQKIYSPVALHFIASTNVCRANKFLKVLKANTIVFIGNQEIAVESIKLLFGNAKHIKTPAINAYSEIDRIYEESITAINFNTPGVICIAMGCSGRALMKRLYMYNQPNNIFLFDFGSLLDGINGNNSRTWLKLNQINYTELMRDL